jgi:hypothetical protein
MLGQDDFAIAVIKKNRQLLSAHGVNGSYVAGIGFHPYANSKGCGYMLPGLRVLITRERENEVSRSYNARKSDSK